MQFENQPTVQQFSGDSILARNKVLRQTYILLAMNVLFSAACAYIGMLMHVHVPTPLYLIGFLGLSFGVNAARNSGLGIILLFAFTGFLGFSISGALSYYFDSSMGSVVIKALVGTAIIFFALSAFVLMTGTNFSFLGGFLFVGALVAFLAGLGALVFHMSALQLAVSGAFLLIFSGYVLYDTSNIIHGYETNYVTATLNLFINLFNIFISLLNILSSLSRD